jgi:hypothetical protein
MYILSNASATTTNIYEAQSIWTYGSNESIEMCVHAGDVHLDIRLSTADFDKD